MNSDDFLKGVQAAKNTKTLLNPQEAQAAKEFIKAATQSELAARTGLWAGLALGTSVAARIGVGLLAVIAIAGVGAGIYLAVKTNNPQMAIDPLSDQSRPLLPAEQQRPAPPARPLVAGDPRYEVEQSQSTVRTAPYFDPNSLPRTQEPISRTSDPRYEVNISQGTVTSQNIVNGSPLEGRWQVTFTVVSNNTGQPMPAGQTAVFAFVREGNRWTLIGADTDCLVSFQLTGADTYTSTCDLDSGGTAEMVLRVSGNSLQGTITVQERRLNERIEFFTAIVRQEVRGTRVPE